MTIVQREVIIRSGGGQLLTLRRPETIRGRLVLVLVLLVNLMHLVHLRRLIGLLFAVVCCVLLRILLLLLLHLLLLRLLLRLLMLCELGIVVSPSLGMRFAAFGGGCAAARIHERRRVPVRRLPFSHDRLAADPTGAGIAALSSYTHNCGTARQVVREVGVTHTSGDRQTDNLVERHTASS